MTVIRSLYIEASGQGAEKRRGTGSTQSISVPLVGFRTPLTRALGPLKADGDENMRGEETVR
jgi:hypothetical protein